MAQLSDDCFSGDGALVTAEAALELLLGKPAGKIKKDGTYRSVSSLRYQPGSLSSILESTGDALTDLISSTQSIATDAR